MKTLSTGILALLFFGPTMPAGAELKGKNEVSVQAGAMIFEGDADLDTSFIYGARLGHYFTERLSAEVAVFPVRSGANITTLYPSLAASYHFRMGKFMPFVQAGAGMLRLQPKGDSASSDLAVHWGGGLKYFYKPEWLFRADIDHVIDTGSGRGTHNLAGVLGVSWLFGTSGQNLAKAVQEVKQEVAKKAQQVLDPDSDGDGIADSKDSCPGTTIGIKVDDRGCPVPLDADKDGVTDDKDQCPGTVAGTVVDEKGCVAAKPDSDTDGVDDSMDECPGTAPGTAVDAKGCPMGTKAIPTDNWVLKGVTFNVGSDVLAPESKATLDEAAAILQPRISVRLEVQGHTDNTGNAAFNMTLSEKRAAAVKAYLVGKGIAADRLEAKGYGASMPVADNSTASGRDANRRIEFKVLSR